MNRITHRIAVVINALVLGVVLSATASAEERRPFRASALRTSTLDMSRYDTAYTITRTRSELKTAAVFHADSQAIDENAIVVFEIRSASPKGSIPRWRCVAIHDVAECLGQPVKVRYLPGDEEVVLAATVKPRMAPESQILIADLRASN